MAPGGLLDRPRVRIVQLPSLHGWVRLRQGMSRHDSGIAARGRGRLVGAPRRAEPGAVARAGPGLVRRVTGSARRSRW